MIRFFEPTPTFLDWLAGYARGRIVVDVGCGDGHLVRQLHKRSVKCMGIDPRYRFERVPRDLSSCILPMEGERCTLLKTTPNLLVLFCRPCHSDFVSRTIYILHPTDEVLYISKPCNVSVDLCDMDVAEIDAPECPEERVYRVVRMTNVEAA